jgi:hypothetical protein
MTLCLAKCTIHRPPYEGAMGSTGDFDEHGKMIFRALTEVIDPGTVFELCPDSEDYRVLMAADAISEATALEVRNWEWLQSKESEKTS